MYASLLSPAIAGEPFRLFSLSHAVVILLFLVFTIPLYTYRHSWNSDQAKKKISLHIGRPAAADRSQLPALASLDGHLVCRVLPAVAVVQHLSVPLCRHALDKELCLV